MLLQFFDRLFRKRSFRQDIDPASACDILIPACGRPDLVRSLLRSLEKNTDRSLLSRVFLGDDASDSYSRSRFQEFTVEFDLPLTVVREEQNVGFGRMCNRLFSLGSARYAVVLNTDVTVPPFWLERLLRPFRDHQNIALATPLSTAAANLTVRLRPGEHWREVDRLLARREPAYPDACTAIGFCLALDRPKVQSLGALFDSAYGRGYGEDTDLHYRALQHGYRSVIVDNLCVRHIGEGSFSSVSDVDTLRADGMKAFRNRWSAEHDKALAAYEQKRPLQSLLSEAQECRLPRISEHVDALFVLPTTNAAHGGVWVLCTLIDAMISCGMNVQAIVEDEGRIISDTSKFGFRVWKNADECTPFIRSVGCVVASAHDTLSFSERLAIRFECPRTLFLQGMEVAFPSGANAETLEALKRVRHVICVSKCLEDYIKFIIPEATVVQLQLGPHPDTFYPRDIKRDPKSVAIVVSANPEKGSVHAMQIGLFLKERGFSLRFFGWEPDAILYPASLGEVLRDTSREALASLFSRTEFFVDCSRFEGLGLLPLEAAFCGCIPVLDVKGGPEYIFGNGRDCIGLGGYKYLPTIIDTIANLTNVEKHVLSSNAMKLRSKYVLPEGLRTACIALAELSGKTLDAACTQRDYTPKWR